MYVCMYVVLYVCMFVCLYVCMYGIVERDETPMFSSLAVALSHANDRRGGRSVSGESRDLWDE